MAAGVRRSSPEGLPGGVLVSLVSDFSFRFMNLRRYTFMFSAFTSIMAMVLFATLNMNYGIDFMGEKLIELNAKARAADKSHIKQSLSEQPTHICMGARMEEF